MKLVVHDWAALDGAQRAALLARPGGGISAEVRERAAAILEGVRAGGEAAARRWHAELGGGELDSVLMPLEEVQASADRLDPGVRVAIDAAYRNIQAFHAGGLPRDWERETLPGVRCETRHLPIGAVGLYVPGGSAVLPSTALMLGVPAQLAGCPVRVLASPAGPDGKLSPAVCYAALRCGVTHVLRVGGAQGIGLLAHGDAAAGVPAVDKIFGPGNAYVTAAKLEVATRGVAIDMPAGPSELLVLADAAARPAFVAADLLSQAEHGPDSQVLLVSDSAELLTAVQGEVARQLAELPRREVARLALEKSRLILVPDLAAALAVSEAYAPEHLSVQVREEAEDALLAGVRRAGSVFVGPFSPEAAGDYASGPSHVLPTAGAAAAYSGLGVGDFMRHMTVQRVSQDGLRRLAPTVTTLAAEEGLEAHRRAVTVRLAAPQPRPTLFIDRDGTLIDEPLPSRQIDSLEKLRLLPGVVPALRELGEHYRLVMVSNQDGLGTASFPQPDFDAPQERMVELLASQGIVFDAVYVCPHREEDGCDCRKPRTGLLQAEIEEGRFTPDSWVIGDRQTDLDLAERLGLGGLHYGPGLGWADIAGRLLRPPRRATLERSTKETQIRIELDLDASGPRFIETGLGFFDHMLDQIATHGGFALNLHARGDLHIDEHHTVEDCGIALGAALKEALGDKRGVARFAHVHLPMDECAAACLLDLSGRPWLEFSATFSRPAVGGLDTSLVEHFFGSLATHLGATVHLSVGPGNAHHQVESVFKAFGRALRGATVRQGRELPSSKGTL